MNTGINTIESFRGLEKGWNGYDAETIPDSLIDRAIEFSKLFSCAYEVFPTNRGTLQFEWFIEGKLYVEVEVFLDKIEVFVGLDSVILQDNTVSGTEEEISTILTLDKFLRKAFGSHTSNA